MSLNEQSLLSTPDLDTYASVYERDIDLVLVAALRASSAVRSLLAAAARLPAADLVSVRHSLATSDGREADVELRLGLSCCPHVIQIENKLDAQFQRDQQQGYSIRTRELSEREDVAEARSVLFCPQAYEAIADCQAFDGVVTYEDLRDLLMTEGPFGREAALLVDHAIRKHRRGGSRSPDHEQRTRFFADFSMLAADRGLPSIPRKARKAGAGFLWWPREETLGQPKGWRPRGSDGAWLAAKFEHGSADIELTGLIPLVDVDQLVASLRDEPVDVATTRKSVQLRVRAPQLDPDQPVSDQSEQATAFVDAVVGQQEWWGRTGREIIEKAMEAFQKHES